MLELTPPAPAPPDDEGGRRLKEGDEVRVAVVEGDDDDAMYFVGDDGRE